ncbi:hypothetical protein HOLleu_12631 [Holothuria leucospilota]|uniref:Uncharacterized protein n=1 Tax=Holothuria leucospilota TaxID=206669 RepID=A0A9Q1CAI6_HOLLE|nr:hypothetical protein HOLleu_12631 [Holothuria leucospilota]
MVGSGQSRIIFKPVEYASNIGNLCLSKKDDTTYIYKSQRHIYTSVFTKCWAELISDAMMKNCPVWYMN